MGLQQISELSIQAAHSLKLHLAQYDTTYPAYAISELFTYFQINKMNGFASFHFEWVYSPENFFHSCLSIPFDGGTIEISDGIVTAKIDPTALQVVHQSADESDHQPDEFAEKLEDRIDELARKIDDKIETLFHSEQKKSHRSYQLGFPFKVAVRHDGSELIAPA